jgi:hypothetical protein
MRRNAHLMGFGGDQEFHRDHIRALVQQLEEGMLAVGAGLAPDDGAGGLATALPSFVTRLPFDSMSSCWR